MNEHVRILSEMGSLILIRSAKVRNAALRDDCSVELLTEYKDELEFLMDLETLFVSMCQNSITRQEEEGA